VVAATGTVAMAVEAVAKAYGATVALDGVTMRLAAGEVHALLGENGAGKSTLVKILSGVVRPDRGTMALFGAPYAPADILAARAAGVATAFQELSLLPNLTVAENLALPRLPKAGGGIISRRATEAAAARVLADYRLEGISPRANVGSLSLAERQRLEIVRAMRNGSRVLILDEPTAALAEVKWLFDLVRAATAKGTAVLYISHRLAEVRSLCARATVLRNGCSIATVELAGASDGDIFEMMVGRSVKAATRAGPRRAGAPVVLAARDLSGPRLERVSFDLREGEVLGVAALEGQGQRELFRCLAGLTRPTGGRIAVDGRDVSIAGPRAALRAGRGIAFLPEERKTEGILTSLTAAGNIALPVIGRISRGGLVWKGLERASAAATAAAVDMSPRYLDFRIGDLSGGNQQKALIARALATGAGVLLLYDPTRGVDVGTKQAIYAAIRRFADDGGAVLFYSSELPEIVHLADRCLVLYGSRVFAELAGEEIEEQRLVSALTGHRHEDAAAGGRRASA
jgi:ribose transport system ATP-binding protein